MVSCWNRGLRCRRIARARNWITFSGTAGQIHGRSGPNCRHYETDGETPFSRMRPSVDPASLPGVTRIRGLDNFRRSHAARAAGAVLHASNGRTIGPTIWHDYDILPLYKAGFDGRAKRS